eukprot:2439451-Amphidinium_carterae.1
MARVLGIGPKHFYSVLWLGIFSHLRHNLMPLPQANPHTLLLLLLLNLPVLFGILPPLAPACLPTALEHGARLPCPKLQLKSLE